MNHSNIVSFLWSVADLLRDSFRRGEYQEVILPLTVLRRLDGVLAPTKQAGLETQARGGSTRREKEPAGAAEDHEEALSVIIAELNERFGLNLGPEHRVTLEQMIERLDNDAALDASSRLNTRENVRLTFDHKVEDVIQEIVDTNFALYKMITDGLRDAAAT